MVDVDALHVRQDDEPAACFGHVANTDHVVLLQGVFGTPLFHGLDLGAFVYDFAPLVVVAVVLRGFTHRTSGLVQIIREFIRLGTLTNANLGNTLASFWENVMLRDLALVANKQALLKEVVNHLGRHATEQNVQTATKNDTVFTDARAASWHRECNQLVRY
ncbi:hypothetical protein D3C84_809900 [compost metagenome]